MNLSLKRSYPHLQKYFPQETIDLFQLETYLYFTEKNTPLWKWNQSQIFLVFFRNIFTKQILPERLKVKSLYHQEGKLPRKCLLLQSKKLYK